MILLVVTAGLMLLSGTAVGLAGLRWRSVRQAPRIAPSGIWRAIARHPWLARATRLDPESTTGFALTAALTVLVIGVAAFGVLLIVVRENLGLAGADQWVANFAARHETQTSTTVLNAFSQLGGTIVIVILCVLALALEARRGRLLAVAGFLLLCAGGQWVVATLVKGLVERARPNVDRLAGFSGSSFPSGHTTAAAATLAALALLAGIGRSSRFQAALTGIAVALAVGVGCTRAFLGVHWLTDVLAGLALGWAWFALCSIAFGGRLMRFAAPAKVAEVAAEVVAPPGDASDEPSGPVASGESSQMS